MLNIVAVVLVFGGIVLIHEFGHFLLAKLNGIGVVEFAIGMGPTLGSIKKGETKYSLKLFPIGGYCMMVGEDANDQSENAFNKKSVWARMSVVLAGPAFNFLLAFVLSMVIVANVGYDSPQLVGVKEGFPAAEQGMQEGDIITKINRTKVTFSRDITMYQYFHPQGEMEVEFVRDGVKHTAFITPRYSEETGSYQMGILMNSGRIPAKGAFEVIKYGAGEVRFWIQNVVQSLSYALRGYVKADEIGGPVRIVGMIGSTVEQTKEYGMAVVLLNLANISVLLSANLGVMNLLPIPALDGGRFLFQVIEAVRGKPMDPEKEGMIHLVGFAVLMVFMVVVLFNDIRNIF